MTTKERIIQFLDERSMPRSVFLKKTGIGRGFLDSDKLHQSVSDRQLAMIHAAFPDISLVWLITGEGDMYSKERELPAGVVPLDVYTELVRENERLRIAIGSIQNKA